MTEVETVVIDEHGSMLSQTDEVLNSISEGNENVAAFMRLSSEEKSRSSPGTKPRLFFTSSASNFFALFS